MAKLDDLIAKRNTARQQSTAFGAVLQQTFTAQQLAAAQLPVAQDNYNAAVAYEKACTIAVIQELMTEANLPRPDTKISDVDVNPGDPPAPKPLPQTVPAQ